MADHTNEQVLNECIDKALNNIKKDHKDIVLKTEQFVAVKRLLEGNDVLAILPTGFGKSMIFTVFALARQELLKQQGSTEKSSVVVISPLKSIILDQIAEMKSLNCSAVELCDEEMDEICRSPPQFIYAIAEKAIEKSFLDVLKDKTALHRSVSAVVVDESHTMETWTGKR